MVNDKDKLISLANFFEDKYKETPSTLKVWGRRFTFNPIGEIIKIQDIIHSQKTKAVYYKTIGRI